MSPCPEDEYFAAGMHEEVLDRLARIRDVNVIASTSVQRYAGGGVPIPVIAADLNVGAIVECSVRYAADRVRVSVRLIDGATAGEVWSDSYDTPLGDVFAVQDEIATKIATALESNLSGQRVAASPLTESVPAYAAYLKAISLYRSNGGIGVGVQASVRGAPWISIRSTVWRTSCWPVSTCTAGGSPMREPCWIAGLRLRRTTRSSRTTAR